LATMSRISSILDLVVDLAMVSICLAEEQPSHHLPMSCPLRIARFQAPPPPPPPPPPPRHRRVVPITRQHLHVPSSKSHARSSLPIRPTVLLPAVCECECLVYGQCQHHLQMRFSSSFVLLLSRSPLCVCVSLSVSANLFGQFCCVPSVPVPSHSSSTDAHRTV
jgi:hypothetical protein